MYQVDSNIPLPASSAGRPAIYPFAHMQIGDSFAVPIARVSAVRRAASMAGRRQGRKFAVRKTTKSDARVWRIA